jgi:hypothetical protein
MEVVRGVREIGSYGDGFLTVKEAPIRTHNRREGRDGSNGLLKRVFLPADA